MSIGIDLFLFLVFPGFVFSALLGLLASFLDRKITARIQYRQGPGVAQPFWDLVKLFKKESIIPKEGSRGIFIFAPLLGLSGAIFCASLIGVAMFFPKKSFIGDVIVLIYALMIPSLGIILGGLASGNPIAGVGVAREMKLLIGYEFGLLISLAVVLIQTNGELSLSQMIGFQSGHRMVALSFSGALGLLVGILGTQAKLGAVPFDIGEAETEISGGVLIEYSGVLLGIYRLSRVLMLFVMPMVLVVLFLGGVEPGIGSIFWGVVKYLAVVLIFILVRNVNPRLRIDQALKFFWFGLGGVGILAIILALLGL